MNKRKLTGLALLLSFSLVTGGCAGLTCPVLTPDQQKSAPAPAEAPAPAPAPEVQEPEPVAEPMVEMVSGLEKTIRQAVEKARATMRTAKMTHDGDKVEVNPMWDFEYKGRVHVRVYSADGKLILDEYRD